MKAGPAATAEAVLSKARDENFTVASLILPPRVRRHMFALYAFARLVDDIGDATGDSALALLDSVETELDLVYGGVPDHPVMVRLAETVHACALPREPFSDLIAANRLDQTKRRYESFDELLDYCSLSANPIGRLVLHVFGSATPDRIALADHVCTALQLVEHLQDVKEDFEGGRVYLPRRDMHRFGVDESDIAAPRPSERLRSLIAFEVGRTRSLLREGSPLVRTLRGRPRFAVAGFIAGGEAALRAIERSSFDVFFEVPKPPKRVIARVLPFAFAGRL